MLRGFTSAWITRREWAYCSPSAMSVAICSMHCMRSHALLTSMSLRLSRRARSDSQHSCVEG